LDLKLDVDSCPLCEPLKVKKLADCIEPKTPESNRHWRRRWLRLLNLCLLFYPPPTNFKNITSPKRLSLDVPRSWDVWASVSVVGDDSSRMVSSTCELVNIYGRFEDSVTRLSLPIVLWPERSNGGHYGIVACRGRWRKMRRVGYRNSFRGLGNETSTAFTLN